MGLDCHRLAICAVGSLVSSIRKFRHTVVRPSLLGNYFTYE